MRRRAREAAIIEREKLVENAAQVGSYFGAKLRETFGAHPLVGEVRSVGMLAALEFMADKEARKPGDSCHRWTPLSLATIEEIQHPSAIPRSHVRVINCVPDSTRRIRYRFTTFSC